MTDDDSDTIINQQILFNLAQYKVSHPGDACAEVLFIFRQNLGWERENYQDYTAPLPLHPFVVFALFSI